MINISNVERFYDWMRKMQNIHLADGVQMAAAFHRVATHKIKRYEKR